MGVIRVLPPEGIEALLRTAFATFRQRGLDHVDLTVLADNAAASRLYHRLGLVEAPL